MVALFKWSSQTRRWVEGAAGAPASQVRRRGGLCRVLRLCQMAHLPLRLPLPRMTLPPKLGTMHGRVGGFALRLLRL
jgi:hypothetical protein